MSINFFHTTIIITINKIQKNNDFDFILIKPLIIGKNYDSISKYNYL